VDDVCKAIKANPNLPYEIWEDGRPLTSSGKDNLCGNLPVKKSPRRVRARYRCVISPVGGQPKPWENLGRA